MRDIYIVYKVYIMFAADVAANVDDDVDDADSIT